MLSSPLGMHGRGLRDLEAGRVKSACTDPAAVLGTGVGVRSGLTRLSAPLRERLAVGGCGRAKFLLPLRASYAPGE